jgi:hypothetical protein
LTLLSENDFAGLVDEVQNRIYQRLEFAWENHQMDDYLRQIDMGDLATQQSVTAWEDSLPYGKIIIFGEAAARENDIVKSIISQGISKDRVELHLGYDELKRYNIGKLQYNSAYRLILVGSLPHSTNGKDSYSSVIARMEQEEGFTKVVRLTSNGQLKITKTNIKEAVQREIESGYLAVG